MFVQIIISKTKPEIAKSDVINLTRKMSDWLKSQPGFLSYELFESKNNWADKIVWANQSDALLGIAAFQETEIGKEMMGYLEPGFRAFMGMPVAL